MVSSKLNDAINYKENRTIEEEDKGVSAIIYEMEVYDENIHFVLGKQKYSFSNKGVLYYPIYLLNENRIKAQIGVFEIKRDRALNVLDSDGDIDVNALGEPLLYSFFTSAFLKNALRPKPQPMQLVKPTSFIETETEEYLQSHKKTEEARERE